MKETMQSSEERPSWLTAIVQKARHFLMDHGRDVWSDDELFFYGHLASSEVFNKIVTLAEGKYGRVPQLGFSVASPAVERLQALRLPSGEGLAQPRQAHEWDAGYDLRSTLDQTLSPGAHLLVDCGFAFAIPRGWVGLVIPRSGIGTKYGLKLRNTVGVIDATYRGPVKLCIENTGSEPYVLRKGDALAQLVVVPCWTGPLELVDELDKTARGEGGFGSTGQ